MNTQIDERKGATSASNAEADLRCQGRHLAQIGIPESDSEDAKFGRAIHEALKNNDGGKLTVEQYSIFESIQKIESQKVAEFFGNVQTQVVREKRFWVKIKHGERVYEHSGQPDVVYRGGTRALVIEYKCLVGDLPSAPTNLQLRDQVVLIHGNTPLLAEIGATVFQPLVTMEPELCVYNKEHIARAEQEMWERVIASNDPAGKRSAGEVQCKFCRARFRCQEYQTWASSMIPALSVFDVPVAQWTPDHRAMFCNRRAVAQKWLDECDAEMKKALKADPKAIPGWKLAPGRLLESVNNPQAVFDKFTELGGKVSQFMQCITVGKTKLKTTLGEVTGQKGRNLDSVLDNLLDGNVTSKRTSELLVRDDGKESTQSSE